MPPETTLEPPTSTPSPTMDAFDATFSDLDSAPAAPTPTTTPNETVPETTRNVPAKDPATGKFTKPDKSTTGDEGATVPKPDDSNRPVDRKSGDEGVGQLPKPASEFEPPQVAKPSELRAYAKKMGGRAQVAEQRVSQLNSQVKALESQSQPNGDTKALTEELANTKKRLEEYEGELKVTRYERSGEYKDKYDKPLKETISKAYRKVSELVVREPKPNSELDENGKPTEFNERLGTANDLDEVYYAGNPMMRRNKAKEKFGDDWQSALTLCDQIREKHEEALEAVQSHKGKAAEFEQQQAVQKSMMDEGRSRIFGEAIGSIFDKYKDLFSEKEGDTKWNEGIAKGRSMADLAFGDRKSLTPIQSTVLDAQIYARVTGYPALKSAYDERGLQLAEKDKEIAELRGSSPGKTAPGAAKSESADLTLDQAFDKFVP